MTLSRHVVLYACFEVRHDAGDSGSSSSVRACANPSGLQKEDSSKSSTTAVGRVLVDSVSTAGGSTSAKTKFTTEDGLKYIFDVQEAFSDRPEVYSAYHELRPKVNHSDI
eukprot:8371-Heterococcus_DN1.PRE.2